MFWKGKNTEFKKLAEEYADFFDNVCSDEYEFLKKALDKNLDIEEPSKELMKYMRKHYNNTYNDVKDYFIFKKQIKQPIINILNKIDSGYFEIDFQMKEDIYTKTYNIKDHGKKFLLNVNLHTVRNAYSSLTHSSLSDNEVVAVFIYAEKRFKENIKERTASERKYLEKLYG